MGVVYPPCSFAKEFNTKVFEMWVKHFGNSVDIICYRSTYFYKPLYYFYTNQLVKLEFLGTLPNQNIFNIGFWPK
jgi:hypothetical protein